MTDLSDCTPVYSHAEEAVQRAFSVPRGNYGAMLSGGVYDGIGCYDKMVQDAMILRFCKLNCSLISLDVFQLQYDDHMEDGEFGKLLKRVISGTSPESTPYEFAMEMVQEWSGRRFCAWKPMRLKQRAAATSIPARTLYRWRKAIRGSLQEAKSGGLAVVRVHLEEAGLM